MYFPAINVKYCKSYMSTVPNNVVSHFHEYWELVYYDGEGIIEINEKIFKYKPNTYILIPAGVLHSERASTAGKIYMVGFDMEITQTLSEPMLFTDTPEKAIRTSLRTLLQELKEKKPLFFQRMNILLQDIILLTMRSLTTKYKDANHTLEMILNYINEYFTTDLSLKNLASALAYNQDYLYHFFKKHMNMSLKDYITDKRIHLAKQLLVSGIPVTEVVKRIGLNSHSHFTSLFKSKTGMSPRQYQKSPSSRSKSIYDTPKD